MAKVLVEKAPEIDIPRDMQDANFNRYFNEYDVIDSNGRYLHWNQLKWRLPKDEAVSIWKAIKLKRISQMKYLPLQDEHEVRFSYCTPPSMEAKLHQIAKVAGGNVGAIDSDKASDNLQSRFLVSSLIMEEAITSAQLEGASTTREVAKKMLEEEREPIDDDERMILNNYLLLKYAENIKDEDLSIDQVLEFHRIATIGTSENNVCPGEFRKDNDIYVEGGNGEIAHQPPDYRVVHERMTELCKFANIDHSCSDCGVFITPVVKAIILHFMIGYEHPFRDGNGRTARAIFYWYMLKCDYTLFKYVSISKLLKEKPKDYGMAYMYSERDQNDLTYFIYFQLDIILAAFHELENYLSDKVTEFQKIAETLEGTEWGSVLHFTQKDLIKKALKEPGRVFTTKEVASSYSITPNTARTRLNELVKMKLFLRSKDGRTMIYIAPSDLAAKLNAMKNS